MHGRFPPGRPGGFTLLEILLVVLLVGIFSMVMLFSVRLGGQDRLIDEELRRMDHLLSLAQDEALFRVVDMGLEVTTEGYHFVTWDGRAWQPPMDSGPFRRRAWPPGVVILLEMDGIPVSPASALPNRNPDPQVMILANGEVTAFTLRLQADDMVAGSLSMDVTGKSDRVLTGAQR